MLAPFEKFEPVKSKSQLSGYFRNSERLRVIYFDGQLWGRGASCVTHSCLWYREEVLQKHRAGGDIPDKTCGWIYKDEGREGFAVMIRSDSSGTVDDLVTATVAKQFRIRAITHHDVDNYDIY